jgi:hypothetical protein
MRLKGCTTRIVPNQSAFGKRNQSAGENHPLPVSKLACLLVRLNHLSLPCGEQKRQNPASVKCWEIIANRLSKAGWNLGWVSAIDSEGRTIWIADAHRGDGKRFVVHADERLTAFLELESATRNTLVPGDLAAPRTKETRSFQLTMKMVLLVRFCGSMPIDCANASA